MTMDMTIIAAIINGEVDDDLDRVNEAVRSRRKELRAREAHINLLTLKPGTRVRLKGLSPKYLNGLEGEIIVDPVGGRRGKARLAVKMDEPVRKYGSIIRPPAGCVEAA